MRTIKCVVAVTLGLALLQPGATRASLLPPGLGGGSDTALERWGFADTNWLSRQGHAPLSFTNLDGAGLGNGSALVLDSTNAAWLQYNVCEGDGSTNLTVDTGSVELWFAPKWAGTNMGGAGPGAWGRLIEAGAWTEQASYGWWSLYTDPDGVNIYFSAQGRDGSGTNYLSAPIAWRTNRWHHIVLTYSSEAGSHSALYLDGVVVTNGPPLTCWPGPEALSNGFFIGSDAGGSAQARGMFDDLATYNYPLDAGAVSNHFIGSQFVYWVNPNNPGNFSLASAPFPAPAPPGLRAITGSGFLQPALEGSNAVACVTSTNVWLAELLCTLVASQGTNESADLSFAIQGGLEGEVYDVFANALLGPAASTNYNWAWMGQGYHCHRYGLTNLPAPSSFLKLGTPLDSDNDGLTDAFENLVSHTDPLAANAPGDGLSDLFRYLHGFSTNVIAVPSLGSISIPACPVP